MGKLISWVFTIPFWVVFLAIFFGFHPLFVVGNRISRPAFDFVFRAMNGTFLLALKLVGTTWRFQGNTDMPWDRPLIIVSNHQSMYDIAFLSWYFRIRTPRFVAKTELARGVPSVSFVLRTTGAALIDRKDRYQAMPEIRRFGAQMAEEGYAAIIFPEGTRARNGVLKRFKSGGFEALWESMPNATVVPVAIDGSWHLLKHNLCPVPFGVRIELRALNVIDSDGASAKEVLLEAQKRIEAQIEEWRSAGLTERPVSAESQDNGVERALNAT